MNIFYTIKKMNRYLAYRYGDAIEFNTFEELYEYTVKHWEVYKIIWGISKRYCFMIPKKNINGKWIRKYIYVNPVKNIVMTEDKFREFGTKNRFI
jgi:hypothetical protein